MEKKILKVVETIKQNGFEEFKISWHFYDSENAMLKAIPNFKEWFEEGYSIRYEFKTFTYRDFLELDMTELKGLCVLGFLTITEKIKKNKLHI